MWTLLPGAQLPQAGVGLVMELPGALADRSSACEILHARHAEQALVEKACTLQSTIWP